MSAAGPFSDEPYALKDPAERERRRGMLHEPHIRPLTEFIEMILYERGLSNEVPYFDPLDGGVRATILGLMESPGPGALESGFISRNNPDPTAGNMFELQRRGGIPRESIALWNVVPWHCEIVSAREIREAEPFLVKLINLLPLLRVIVLFGRHAQSQRKLVARCFNGDILDTWHTSGQALNPQPSRRDDIVAVFQHAHGLSSQRGQ